MKDNSWNNVELRDNRYNQIVHMVSAAKGAEEYYSTEVGFGKKRIQINSYSIVLSQLVNSVNNYEY